MRRPLWIYAAALVVTVAALLLAACAGTPAGLAVTAGRYVAGVVLGL